MVGFSEVLVPKSADSYSSFSVLNSSLSSNISSYPVRCTSTSGGVLESVTWHAFSVNCTSSPSVMISLTVLSGAVPLPQPPSIRHHHYPSPFSPLSSDKILPHPPTNLIFFLYQPIATNPSPSIFNVNPSSSHTSTVRVRYVRPHFGSEVLPACHTTIVFSLLRGCCGVCNPTRQSINQSSVTIIILWCGRTRFFFLTPPSRFFPFKKISFQKSRKVHAPTGRDCFSFFFPS